MGGAAADDHAERDNCVELLSEAGCCDGQLEGAGYAHEGRLDACVACCTLRAVDEAVHDLGVPACRYDCELEALVVFGVEGGVCCAYAAHCVLLVGFGVLKN